MKIYDCGFLACRAALKNALKNRHVEFETSKNCASGCGILIVHNGMCVGDLKEPTFDGELKPAGHSDWKPISEEEFEGWINGFIVGYRLCNHELT